MCWTKKKNEINSASNYATYILDYKNIAYTSISSISTYYWTDNSKIYMDQIQKWARVD
jgi:hypothetical protein